MKKLETPKKDLKPEAVKAKQFTLTGVSFKPTRTFHKGSKYDEILTAFLEGVNDIVKIEIQGVKPFYLQIQLKKRATARNLNNVKISTANSEVYLEKIKEPVA